MWPNHPSYWYDALSLGCLERLLGSDWPAGVAWPGIGAWRFLIGARQQGFLGGTEPCLLIGSQWWGQSKGRGSACPRSAGGAGGGCLPGASSVSPQAVSCAWSPHRAQTRERRDMFEVVKMGDNDPPSGDLSVPGVLRSPQGPPPPPPCPPRSPPGSSGQPFLMGSKCCGLGGRVAAQASRS